MRYEKHSEIYDACACVEHVILSPIPCVSTYWLKILQTSEDYRTIPSAAPKKRMKYHEVIYNIFKRKFGRLLRYMACISEFNVYDYIYFSSISVISSQLCMKG